MPKLSWKVKYTWHKVSFKKEHENFDIHEHNKKFSDCRQRVVKFQYSNVGWKAADSLFPERFYRLNWTRLDDEFLQLYKHVHRRHHHRQCGFGHLLYSLHQKVAPIDRLLLSRCSNRLFEALPPFVIPSWHIWSGPDQVMEVLLVDQSVHWAIHHCCLCRSLPSVSDYSAKQMETGLVLVPGEIRDALVTLHMQTTRRTTNINLG